MPMTKLRKFTYISMCCGDKCCVKYEIYVRNGRQGLQNVRFGGKYYKCMSAVRQ